MARINLVRKQNYYQWREQFQSNQRPIGNKNILNRRIWIRDVKIKKILPQFKNVEVKHRGRVDRRMIVMRETIYLCDKRRLQYWRLIYMCVCPCVCVCVCVCVCAWVCVFKQACLYIYSNAKIKINENLNYTAFY